MTTAQTTYGTLKGTTENGVAAFKGIPFATPPVGDLRFRPPQPPAAWTGVREAKTFGPAAPQIQAPGGGLFARQELTTDEDCLTLNVWTPAVDDGRRPVMVWIHGGAFVTGTGSSPMYDGSALVRRGDVVVVTVNYRLGVLGFLADSALRDDATGIAGNWGLADQIAALEWVRDNIASFGGDPANVTIFGESAGGMSVSTLMGIPAAKGLFRRVIAESGAPMAEPPGHGQRVAARIVELTGAASIEDLRNLPVDAILDAQQRASEPPAGDGALGTLPFQPVVDGGLLPRSPWDEVADGSAAGVSLVTGTTLDEMKLFTAMAGPGARTLDEDTLRRRLARSRTSDEDVTAALETYTKARLDRGAPVEPAELWSAMETDRFFRIPAMRHAAIQREHAADTYAYLFTWCSPAMGGILGSCHALEIPFVFGNLAQPGMSMFAGEGPDAEALSAAMQDAWLAFARTGNPSTDTSEWPSYDTSRRATMVFGTTSAVEDAPLERERAYWDA